MPAMQDNLPELRDIHLPEGVSAFPLAYGWWVIILSVVATFFLIKFFLYLRRKSKKRYALKLIERVSTTNPILASKQYSEILRRICVLKYPKAATLYGQEWLEFLHRHCRQKLNEAEAGLLLNAPYMSGEAKGYGEKEIREIKQFCIAWIGENL